MLEEGDESGKVGHHLSEIAGLDVVEELWDEGDELVDVVEACGDVVFTSGWGWENGNWGSSDG